jgi:GntR family transcriptional regulator
MNSTRTDRDIQISLDTAGGVPFYRQIIRQIEHAILAEKLLPGDRLPTIRALAIELKINPNTIARAYGEMEIRGIVTTQVGSGTYVSDKKPSSQEDGRSAKIREVLVRFLRDMDALGVDRAEAAELVRDFKEEI